MPFFINSYDFFRITLRRNLAAKDSWREQAWVFTLNISGRQEIESAIRKKAGGAWLDLTAEQYAKLSRDPGHR